MRTVYGLLWIGWIAAFLAIELTAIGTGHAQYTLSDFVWRLEQLGKAWTAVRLFVCLFALWLFLHMTFGWFR